MSSYIFSTGISQQEMNRRLEITKMYLGAKGIVVANCANLVLVIMGIVGTTDYNIQTYLDHCTLRQHGTPMEEAKQAMGAALARCGKPATINELAISPASIVDLSRTLGRGYSTIIYLQWKGGPWHAVLIHRPAAPTPKGSELLLIDPQITGPDGSYPFTIGDQDMLNYLIQYTQGLYVFYSDAYIGPQENCAVDLIRGGKKLFGKHNGTRKRTKALRRVLKRRTTNKKTRKNTTIRRSG